jgi:signal transduction histidine kinase
VCDAMFAEIPPPPGPPPRAARALRAFGTVVLAAVVVTVLTAEPRPALEGEGAWVLLSLVALLIGLAGVLPYRPLPPGTRFAGLVTVGVASCVLTAVQPNGAALTGIYLVVIISALHLPRPLAWIVGGVFVVAATVILATVSEHADGAEFAFLASVVPWFLVMSLVRQLVASRAALAEAVAVEERSRLARDMHDVLAHSLSALALQLEATRLLARERGADPEVVQGVERAHHLAAGGLDEARRAIAALRGDELPGPERLETLAAAFNANSDATCTVAMDGEPRPLGADARLALYRTAQEALTNVLRHSAAERVEIRLSYEPDGVALVVADHGDGAPVAVGAAADGYGLTGMRERAELLGGRLSAGPTSDGYRVELWLPA